MQLQTERMTVSKLSSPAATLLTLGYTFNGSSNNGSPNTHTIYDGVVTRTQNFVYDAANRLSQACEANVGSSSCTITSGSPTWTGNRYGQAYGYDDYNNRWIHPNGTLAVLNLQPTSAVAFVALTNRFNASTFGGTFDNAGQMEAQFAASTPTKRVDEKWDAAGQRVESKYTYDAPANTKTMAYDGLGNRVKKLNPVAGNTVYVYNAFGELAAEYAGGAGEACSPCYLFQDAVGSTRLMVNQNQMVVRRYDSMPFGEEIYNGAGWANGRTAAEYAARTRRIIGSILGRPLVPATFLDK